MKMKGVDLVMVEDGEEEIGEGEARPAKTLCRKKG